MKKSDIAMMIYDRMETTKSGAEDLVNDIFSAIAEAMAKGEDVDIAGFGKFMGVMRDAREARNPRTGETVKVPAQRVPKFRAAKGLKDTVRG